MLFIQAERAHPGLTEDFIGGVLEAELMRDKLSLPEALLRLALNDMDQYMLISKEDEFVQLNFRAKGIKDGIDWIPDDQLHWRVWWSDISALGLIESDFNHL